MRREAAPQIRASPCSGRAGVGCEQRISAPRSWGWSMTAVVMSSQQLRPDRDGALRPGSILFLSFWAKLAAHLVPTGQSSRCRTRTSGPLSHICNKHARHYPTPATNVCPDGDRGKRGKGHPRQHWRKGNVQRLWPGRQGERSLAGGRGRGVGASALPVEIERVADKVGSLPPPCFWLV